MTASRVIPLGPDAEYLRVVIAPAADSGESASSPPVEQTEARWSELCAHNPRLFDGRILAFVDYDSRANVVHARTESFKRMAVQPDVPTGVTQFGVTGLLTSGQGDGRRVLLGQRGRETFLYPGRWELAPSGGVDAPREGVRELSIEDLRRQMEREVHEELAIVADGLHATPIALCHDRAAPSMDVIFAIQLDPGEQPTAHDWEYADVCWMPLRDAGAALSDLDAIEPSRAVLNWFADFTR